VVPEVPMAAKCSYCDVVGCHTMSFRGWIPTFRLLPPRSDFKSDTFRSVLKKEIAWYSETSVPAVYNPRRPQFYA
jgi:hypothetical protein